MKSIRLCGHIAAVLLTLSFLGAPARAASSFTIDLLTTFDYPGTGNLTRPQKINDGGDIAGSFVDSSGVNRGFVRFRNGDFSAPIVEPNQDFLTDVRGINNSGLVAGYYISGNFAHGFFLSGTTYTEFDIPGALNTYINVVNNAGDFGGTMDIPGANQAFVSLGGNITTFSVPGAVTTAIYGLTDFNQTVGAYMDNGSVFHGFFRDSDGRLAFPIDPPGATQTFIFGINDRGWMVGRYVDGTGTHGILYLTASHFIVFDYPGATFTSLNGINQQGVICGRYLDNSGLEHGIIARVRRATAE